MNAYALDHPVVREYLQRFDAATAHLPPDERVEIRDGIRSHLIAALAEASSEADVRTALDALGTPEEIVGAQSPAEAPVFVPRPVPRTARGPMEIFAVIFLLVGAFVVPALGWVIGVVLLWVSRAWTVPEKVVGTLVVPGGLLTPALLLVMPFRMTPMECTTSPDSSVTTCTNGVLPLWLSIPLALFVFLGPIVVAVYLLRVAGRRPAS